jgi:exodeoxyribonuclease VII large subunit
MTRSEMQGGRAETGDGRGRAEGAADAGPDSAAERRVLTVRQVNEEIAAAVTRAFPRTLWVRGEVQRLPHDADRRTHVYFELHETGRSGAAEYQIPVSLMGWDRQRYGLGRYLDGSDPDFRLANKLEVCLECRVDFYAKFGKLSLKIVGVDKTFALGRLEAQRRATLAYLEAHGLIGLNAAVSLPDLPLHVGLITAPGSAAEQDFRTGLGASPWPFRVHFVGARMQGEQLQGEVVRALRRQVDAGVDVIVLTRGGGSRADLSWFDQRDLAEAIARCPVPVVTAIGHEIDRSIADVVAHVSCKTPTAAAEHLVDVIQGQADRVADAAARLALRSTDLLDTAARRLAVGDRLPRVASGAVLRARVRYQAAAARLQRTLGRTLIVRRGRLVRLGARLGRQAGDHLMRRGAALELATVRLDRTRRAALRGAQRTLDRRQAECARAALRPLVPWTRRLDGYATQLRLLDPTRLLERGYTITLGPDGRAVRLAGDLAPGDRVATVFRDGRVTSIVQPGDDAGQPRKARKRGGKQEETDTGQETLFR